jgi:hypothetical protein
MKTRKCNRCGKEFVIKGSRHRFCTDACRLQEYGYERLAGADPAITATYTVDMPGAVVIVQPLPAVWRRQNYHQSHPYTFEIRLLDGRSITEQIEQDKYPIGRDEMERYLRLRVHNLIDTDLAALNRKFDTTPG